jgi:hypothetical protein
MSSETTESEIAHALREGLSEIAHAIRDSFIAADAPGTWPGSATPIVNVLAEIAYSGLPNQDPSRDE